MTAAEFLPARRSLTALKKAAAGCRGCPLYRDATQTVFGEGRRRAPLMLVGEQPGDLEDQEGRPFVGPAGKLLRELLAEAEIPSDYLYLTNAVKHFKWTPRGKKRLHAKPSARETTACRPWLEAEVQAVEPQVIVCLGATAVRSVLGNKIRLTRDRGRALPTAWKSTGLCTFHPSAVLRAPTPADRRDLRRMLRRDLAAAWKLVSR